MNRAENSDDADRVDASFNRVLEAEARARERLDDCRREAADLIAAAEERVRRIETGTERRLLMSHRLADASVARALKSLLAADPGPSSDEPDAAELERLDQAIAALADAIIGRDDARDQTLDMTPPT